jgi:acyl-CoA hydrolase
METRVVVTAEDVISGTLTHTNTAYIVYVALDDIGRPTPVPQVLCQTSEDEERFQRAAERQNNRLRSREQES